jgi:hypothetical protein
VRDESTLETVVGLVVLVAVATQTWILLQDATQGDAGRHVRRWWHGRARPAVVRLVTLVDTRAVTAAMIEREIVPYLEAAS